MVIFIYRCTLLKSVSKWLLCADVFCYKNIRRKRKIKGWWSWLCVWPTILRLSWILLLVINRWMGFNAVFYEVLNRKQQAYR
ncbi:hypothetical protein Hanom_Chr17g01565321 [Helianthus anomalus]